MTSSIEPELEIERKVVLHAVFAVAHQTHLYTLCAGDARVVAHTLPPATQTLSPSDIDILGQGGSWDIIHLSNDGTS